MATISGHAKNSSTAGVASLDSASLTLSGSNLVVYAGVENGAAAPAAPSAVKWRGSTGTALTLQGTYTTIDAVSGGGSNVKAGLFRLIAPAAATDVGNATWSAGQDETLIIVVGASGVDQTTPNTTIVTNTGFTVANVTTISTALTGLTNGATAMDLAVFVKYEQDSYTLVKDASQTLIEKIDGTSPGFENMGMSYATVSGTTKTMQWTITPVGTNDSVWWAAWGFQLIDAGGGGATQNIALNGYAAPGIYGSAASAPGAVGVFPSGYAARGIYGAAAAAPGAVNIALNGLVAQGIYGALTANSIYPVTLSPVVAQAIFGNDTVTPGAANITPSSVVGQAIFGAISAAMGSTQDIQPASVVGQGVSGSFTLVPGAVALSLGDTVAQGVSGSFSLAPGAVGLSLTGYAAKGTYGPLTMSFNINMNSIVAQASIGGLAVAVGPVTVLPNSLVAQSEFGPLVVTIPGGTAALIAQSQLFIGMGIRI